MFVVKMTLVGLDIANLIGHSMMMLLILVAGASWFYYFSLKTTGTLQRSISYFLTGVCLVLAATSIWWWWD